MRDLLPPQAADRAWLSARLIQTFAAWGYDLVTTPPFELAEVIERGLETVDRRDLLRFVEPDTGEVALLRPDITPQIARIVATRLADRPAPWRLGYASSVIRQRRGRARRQRQIAQAGVELIGAEGPDADAEVIALAARALADVGLTDVRIELHLVSLARAALARVPAGAQRAVEHALSRKDGAELARVLTAAGVGSDDRKRLLGAADLYGEPSLLRGASKVFGSEAEPLLKALRDVVRRLEQKGLADRLVVDLGEVRDAAYYTGVSFNILAHGPGEAIGSGGRYDALLARFGLDAPATGFGIDLSNLEWALAAAGRPVQAPRPVRFVVAGAASEREAAADRLRAASLIAAVVAVTDARSALDYASAWGYDAAVLCRRNGWTALRATDRRQRSLARDDLAGLAAWARGEGNNEGA